MVNHRIVARIQEDPVTLIHESRVLFDIFRILLSNNFPFLMTFWSVFSPYEELVRTVAAIWGPTLMGLDESCLRVGKSIGLVRIDCRNQQDYDRYYH